jgi:hypothetical protein
MVVLGGWRFLVREVALHPEAVLGAKQTSEARIDFLSRFEAVSWIGDLEFLVPRSGKLYRGTSLIRKHLSP